MKKVLLLPLCFTSYMFGADGPKHVQKEVAQDEPSASMPLPSTPPMNIPNSRRTSESLGALLMRTSYEKRHPEEVEKKLLQEKTKKSVMDD